MPRPATLLSSEDAAAYLGIKLQTLYAYASRGLVRGLPGPRGRGRRYRLEDLEPLRARSAGPAAQALRFGDPVLETRLTRISARGPEYRGLLAATDLALGGVSFEAVAELLWTGELPGSPPRWPAPSTDLPLAELMRWLPTGSPPLEALALAVPALAAASPLRTDTDPAAMLASARLLIPRLAACCALAVDPRRLAPALEAGDTVRALALALGAPMRPKALDLLRLALILCADHELNPSTFAARVAASTGADLFACVSAGVATLGGPRHGGASERVELFAQEARVPDRAAFAVRERMRRGERLPGFGQPLYPNGDPRAQPLLAAATALAPRAVRVRTILALVEAMERAGKPKPNLDVGLAAACAALQLPIGMGPAILAVGRCVGWVAHVIEQQESAVVLRPRARFSGDPAAR